MIKVTHDLNRKIHRHTGGLEIQRCGSLWACPIHRHTGGLESQKLYSKFEEYIHRHTGGLEITII